MKNSLILFLLLFLLGSCGQSESETPLPEEDVITTSAADAGDLAMMLIRVYLLKTTNQHGQTVYINREGEMSFTVAAATSPFLVSGSGGLLEGNFIGTVAHLSLGEFNKDFVSRLILEANETDEEEDDLFVIRLAELIEANGLPDPYTDPWEFHEVQSIAILGGSPKNPILKSLDEAPKDTPDYSLKISFLFDDESKDVAIYKISSRLPKRLEKMGYTISDLITEEEVKMISLRQAISTFGYPENIRQWVSQEIRPKPTEGIIQGIPGPGFEMFETNLVLENGASGSFVMDEKTKKVIGLVSMGNLNTALITPAHYLANIYQSAKNADLNQQLK